MSKTLLKALLAIFTFIYGVQLHAQSITGPTCVFSGVQYSYTLSAYYSGSANYSYSVSGGTLSTGGSTGTHSGPGVTSLLITWTSSGSITLNSPVGYTFLSVTKTTALSGGNITSGQSQNIAYNTTPVTLQCAVATGGTCNTPNYLYQWQQSPDNVSFGNIAGATAQNYTFSSAATESFYYRRFVQETNSGNTAYSSVASVIINPPNPILPVVGGSVNPGSQNINYNSTPSSLSISGIGGGTYAYSFQWQTSTDNQTWSNISASLLTYAPPALTANTYYRVAVTSNGSTAYSAAALVNVYPQIQPGLITPEIVTIASGSNPGAVNSSLASGGNGSYTYQWQNSSDGINYSNITGATSLFFLPGNLSANSWYRMAVNSNGATAYSNPAVVAISNVPPDLNYIRIREVLKASVTDTATAGLLSNTADVRQTTQYFDGLGRSVQTVVNQQTPLQHDLVSINVYDGFGREAIKFMPYAASTGDGNFKNSATADLYNFNATQFPTEQFLFNHTYYEASPLNRVSNVTAPGLSWEGVGQGIIPQYLVNAVADSVRIWTITISQGSLPATNTCFLPGTLYKNVSIDEAGHQVIDYKDLEGRSILKKVQLAASPGTAHVGWLCTYYVYDVMGHLRFVIPPLAITAINSNWNISAGLANELCFRYEYDQRHRMIIKKVPGAGETWMVYDARNRPVMTQDSLLRTQQKWTFTCYDTENRPDSTGLITDPSNYNNLNYHLNLAAATTNYPVIGTYTNELLTNTFYDNYSWASAAGLSQTMATGITGNGNYFYTSYNASPVYAVNPSPSYITRGMSTGSMIKVLGTASQFLSNVLFYDDRGRVIQNQSSNYTGGIDTVTNQYNFSGWSLRNLYGHKKNGTNAQSHLVNTKMNYDGRGRLLTIYKNIDNTGDQLIATNTYNELGQLKNKAIGNGLENLAYEYNVRGWLNNINKNFVAGTATNYFGMELGYDKTTSVAGTTSYITPQYNGNIEGTVWKSKGDGVNRKYDFVYDNVNRITAANFVQNTSGSTWDNSYLDFTVNNLSYDANGNIQGMNQKGFKINGSALIDQLSYTYQTNSNKLLQVSDAANDPGSTLGDFHYTGTKQATDYSYDGNGNLITDNNKSISGIAYNYLNLPQQVTITSKGTISYTYDAGGNKMKKLVQETSKPDQTTLYMGGFVYQNDSLQFTGHEEGRIRWAFHKYLNGTTGYGWEYDFFLKDHLGNTRMVLTQQKDTAQYIATMEAAYRTTENALFYNIPQSSYGRSLVSGYPTDGTTTPNDSLAKVNGSGQKTGPALLLKVMSGDVIDIATKSFYKSGGTVNSPNNSFNDVLTSLATGIVGATSAAHGTFTDLTNAGTSQLYSGLNSFITNNDPNTTGKPKAYLNWMLLDDQFKSVTTYPQSGAIPVGNADVLNTLANTGIPMTKNGYLYIWVSNETPAWDVFFDNLSVKQYAGAILEESHYYPFGLTMAGISSKALSFGAAENKLKYNGGSELQSKEFSDGSGLEMYDTHFRQLDPQLGRWWQIDSKPIEMASPYSAMNNNPILLNDPMGDTTWVYNQNGVLSGVVGDQLKNQVHFIKTDGDPESQFSTKGMTKKELNALGKEFRKNSFAFIGAKTVSDLQKIAGQSESIGKEISYVGNVGSDKEIRLTALPVDARNHINSVDAGGQINDQYPDAKSQSDMVLYGHTHVVGDWTTSDANPQKAYGEPSPGSAQGDYGNVLYRNGTTQTGPSPALVGTKYGITVYGSKEVYSNNSYLLYKSLKK